MSDYAFNFKYNITDLLMTDSSSNSYYEDCFVLFSKEQILESPFNTITGNEFKQLFVNDNNFKYKYEYDFLLYISDENEIPDTINLLMDAIYCINTALFNPIMYNNFIPLGVHLYLISDFQNNNLHKFPEIIYGTNINYIAMYTELLKAEMYEIKFILSALFHLYNATDEIDKNLANKFLDRINKIYNLKINDFEVTNKEAIKNGLFAFLSSKNFKKNKNDFSLKINFRDFDKFIKLLSNFNSFKLIQKNNCFCLIQEGEKYYFSFSGYNNSNVYDALGKKIEEKLNEYYPNTCKMFQFCKKDENMLSYGYKKLNHDFEHFSKPLRESEQDNPSPEKIEFQYSCCERKIFPYIKNKSESMYIYCKYEPCVRCMPAIEEKKKIYGDNFMYFAFIKNAKEFSIYLEEKKKTLPKKEDFIFTLKKSKLYFI